MEQKISKVLENLFVGNINDSKNRGLLRRFGITHIISILEKPKRVLYDKYYLCITAEDVPEQNLSQFFTVVNDFIHCARLNNNKVLVHCQAGVSRSVTMTMAYIMSVTNMDRENALRVIQSERYIANPNDGFLEQLQEFECNGVEAERKRLRRKFGGSEEMRKNDKKWCRDALRVHAVLLATNPDLFDNARRLMEDQGINEMDDGEYEENADLLTGRRKAKSRASVLERREWETDGTALRLEGTSSGEDILINVRLYKPAPKRTRSYEGKFVSTIDSVENFNETHESDVDESCNLKLKFNK